MHRVGTLCPSRNSNGRLVFLNHHRHTAHIYYQTAFAICPKILQNLEKELKGVGRQECGSVGLVGLVGWVGSVTDLVPLHCLYGTHLLFTISLSHEKEY